MKYLQAALAVSAMMFCYTGYAEDDVTDGEGIVLKGICQQVVQEVDREMGRQVATCVPATSVRHGHPDVLLVVANQYFDQEEARAKWLGLSILAASRAAENLSTGSGLKLATLLVDQADHPRQSLKDISLCNLSFDEVNTLSHRQGAQDNPARLYRDSRCNHPKIEDSKAAGEQDS